MEQFERMELLFGKEKIDSLFNKRVLIFGVGGVGGYVCEALARSGIGHFMLVDKDSVSISNINRQIIATTKTVSMDKVDVMKERILSINPEALVDIKKCFYLPENESDFDFSSFDYVVDCVDTVSAKISIICAAKKNGINVISAMGAGNKMDLTKLEITDISKTSVDPLARVMRYELRKRNIKGVKVAYSKEEPIEKVIVKKDVESGKDVPGSAIFVPAAMGLLIASEIIKDFIYNKI